MVPNVVQPIPDPAAVGALKQLVGGDVDLLVAPGVLFVLAHVVALLAGDGIVLLDLVSTGSAVEIHLEHFMHGNDIEIIFKGKPNNISNIPLK